ncbi:MAG: class I SAM-dependent methyltransferase [Gammaproteobacteria bacterium]|nr:class I SAM-dependent methyltransferase [Gammaproteobacteria bacterium]MDH3535433.1 class I SAM-dependent methyltransferase [Gammaproteobacteria bacterium]
MEQPHHHKREACRLCGARNLECVLELTPTPPANAMVPAKLLDQAQQCYPIDVYFCESCHHAQLLDIIDPSYLFEEYVYVSGTSSANVDHFRRYADQVIGVAGLEPGDLVVEIGSNDGTMLRFFKDAGMQVLGIDPAQSIAEAATADGIETLPEFFTPELAERIRREHGPIKVVVANNVCAHIDDLESAVTAARILIKPAGVFVFQVSYLLDVYEKTLFDTMYHEHVDYHRVGPLQPFFERLGMKLWDTYRMEAQGGSLRGYVSMAESDVAVQPSVSEMMAQEAAAGLDAPTTLRNFARSINRSGTELMSLLTGLKSRGHSIAGYGAPAKSTTLMYHFGLGPEVIDYIVEDNPLKHGMYTPGLHIPVVSTDALYEKRPDYVVILAWNFAEPIISMHRKFTQQGGRFIVPLPLLGIR